MSEKVELPRMMEDAHMEEELTQSERDERILASSHFQELVRCFGEEYSELDREDQRDFVRNLLGLVKELDGVWKIQFHYGPLMNWYNFNPLRSETMRQFADAIDIVEKHGFYVNASYGGTSYYMNLCYGDKEDAYSYGQPPWTRYTFNLELALEE